VTQVASGLDGFATLALFQASAWVVENQGDHFWNPMGPTVPTPTSRSGSSRYRSASDSVFDGASASAGATSAGEAVADHLHHELGVRFEAPPAATAPKSGGGCAIGARLRDNRAVLGVLLGLGALAVARSLGLRRRP
jgi:hypothetical protein